MWIVIMVFIVGLGLLLILGFCFIAAYFAKKRARIQVLVGQAPLGPDDAYNQRIQQEHARRKEKLKEYSEKLKLEKFGSIPNPLKQDACAICMADYEEGDDIRAAP